MKRAWQLPDGYRVEQEGPEWRLYRKGRASAVYQGDAEGLVGFCYRNRIADLEMTEEEAKKVHGKYVDRGDGGPGEEPGTLAT